MQCLQPSALEVGAELEHIRSNMNIEKVLQEVPQRHFFKAYSDSLKKNYESRSASIRSNQKASVSVVWPVLVAENQSLLDKYINVNQSAAN